MGLIKFLLLAAYLYGAWRFWTGYRATNFNTSLPNRVAFTLLWPAFLAFSPSYRQNFRKAIKGSRY